MYSIIDKMNHSKTASFDAFSMASTIAVDSLNDFEKQPFNGSIFSAVTNTSPYNCVPMAFTMFKTKSKSEGTTVHIGLQEGQPLNAVTTTCSLSMHTTLKLHKGLHRDSPDLARAINRFSMGKTVRVTIPAASNSNAEAVDETMHGHRTPTAMKFDFEFDVGNGKEQHREEFEWRQSQGPEARSIGRGKMAWKLVRLGSAHSEVKNAAKGQRNEGEEVVAVWATNYNTSRLAGDFKFVGSGSTGKLGGNWAIMTVVTAMSIGKIMRDITTAAII